ncbi:MAG: hypothetical protein HC915_00880 [Anaerolineae bacterium]|nr:hypothetical protein [Anaerolineae bacterium]
MITTERLTTLNFDWLHGKYLVFGIFFGFFRIAWHISATSGLLGQPPAEWIEGFTDGMRGSMWLYALLGAVVFSAEALRRRQAQQNDPLAR